MSAYNVGAEVVALVTGVRAGLDVREVVKMVDDGAREGAPSAQEVIQRLVQLSAMFAITTAYICTEWDRADGTGVATRYMAELGRVSAENPG
ncbi:hypothetical protein ACI2LC_17605 [Nonomuraea wenchangensis]|uniref:hypothetical protein n=1 Tax=Nonomuraea wenchangensis TaxID=568860 RepID=UPI00384B4F32